MKKAIVASSLALVLVGGYGALDAAELVPGILTFEDPRPPITPYPEPVAHGMADGADPADVRALPQGAPVPDAAAVAERFDAILENADLGDDLGIDVRDAATGAVLYERGPTSAHTPASTTKVLTSAAALTAIGSNTTFATDALVEGDEVVLRGGGDTLLGAGESDPESVEGRAGLQTLARYTADALKGAGTTTVTVGYDDSLYTGPGLHPSWAEADVANGYAAPVTPLMIEAGRTEEGVDDSRTMEPSVFATETFVGHLEDEGITVEGEPERAEAPDVQPTATIESAPVSDIVKKLMVDSDNIVAEAIGRQVAISLDMDPSFDGAAEAVLEQLAAEGIDTTGVELTDLSGLSYDNQVTPRALSDVVALATTTQGPLAALSTTLPIAGLSGTMGDRYLSGNQAEAAGNVRAKTGTLRTVTSLAGTLVTADDRLLVFALMSDGLDAGRTLEARDALDSLTTSLTECGCS